MRRCEKYFIAFYEYREKICQEGSLTAFSVSYLDMVTVLLNFIFFFGAGNWHLYVESIRSMLPWVFAYNRYNYSGYLTLYFVNMFNLDTSYLDIYEEFLNGNFAVQQLLTNTFGKLEPNKVIKTTTNKGTKVPSGITGTSNKGLPYLNPNSI